MHYYTKIGKFVIQNVETIKHIGYSHIQKQDCDYCKYSIILMYYNQNNIIDIVKNIT